MPRQLNVETQITKTCARDLQITLLISGASVVKMMLIFFKLHHLTVILQPNHWKTGYNLLLLRVNTHVLP